MIQDMEEGFCELVAHKYMEIKGETEQMRYIENNTYTKGKIMVLLAAEQKYGFGAVLDWIRSGEDVTLNMDHLERIRALNGKQVTSSSTGFDGLYGGSATAAMVKPKIPTSLSLKSISGSGTHRFAMINSTTFEAQEKAHIRLGETNVLVQCIEIHDDSVVIHIDGAGANTKLELASH
jgi:hypothetical protein